jgi:hypothetical protein
MSSANRREAHLTHDVMLTRSPVAKRQEGCIEALRPGWCVAYAPAHGFQADRIGRQ